MKINELATGLALEQLLIVLAEEGVKCAKEIAEQREVSTCYRFRYHDRISVVCNAFASILPGISLSQVRAGFEKFKPDRDPDVGFRLEEVLTLIETIRNVWKKGA